MWRELALCQAGINKKKTHTDNVTLRSWCHTSTKVACYHPLARWVAGVDCSISAVVAASCLARLLCLIHPRRNTKRGSLLLLLLLLLL